MVVGNPTGPVEIPRQRWAATIERMRDGRSSFRYGHTMGVLEPCEVCGVEVLVREDLTDGHREWQELLSLRYETDGDRTRGIAARTRDHPLRARPRPMSAPPTETQER